MGAGGRFNSEGGFHRTFVSPVASQSQQTEEDKSEGRSPSDEEEAAPD